MIKTASAVGSNPTPTTIIASTDAITMTKLISSLVFFPSLSLYFSMSYALVSVFRVPEIDPMLTCGRHATDKIISQPSSGDVWLLQHEEQMEKKKKTEKKKEKKKKRKKRKETREKKDEEEEKRNEKVGSFVLVAVGNI